MNFQSYFVRLNQQGIPFLLTLIAPTPRNIPGFTVRQDTPFASHVYAEILEVGSDFVLLQYGDEKQTSAIPFTSILLIEELGAPTEPELDTLESDA
jgi:hypothetical protein